MTSDIIDDISKLRTKGFLKDIFALINPSLFISIQVYTMGKHILIKNVIFTSSG